MFKTKRKRAVVLALIAFFCTAAVTYVAVDWKRFGGGFLAFFKSGKNEPVASSGNGAAGSKPVQLAHADTSHPAAPALPVLKTAGSRKHAAGIGGNGHVGEDDLFKFGNPAAGGIPPGSFIVAQNDTPAGNNGGGAGVTSLAGAPAAPETGGGGPGVSSPAPAPAGTGTGAGPGDGGLSGGGTSTPPPPAGSPPATTPPAPTPPVGSPPATPPAPAPTQSGTTDDPPPPPPPIDSPPPPSTSLPPVSAVPEASSTAMMTLGLLFAATAASRKRKQS